MLFRTRDSRREWFICGSHPSFVKSCPVVGQPLARPGVWLSQNSWTGPYSCTIRRRQKVIHTESLKWDAHCLYLGIAGCHSTGLSKKVNLQGWQGRAKMHPRHFYGLVLAFFKLWMGRVPHDQISQSSPDSNTEDSKKKKKISIPLHPSCSIGSGTHAHLPGNFAHQILPNSMNLQLRLPRDPQSSLVFSLSSIHTTASRSLLLHCPSSCFNITMESFSWSGCS